MDIKNIRYSLNEINKIAIPIIFSSISSVLLSLVDQAIVGRISVYAYAGVGLVTNVINSLIGVLGIISVAFNILGAKSKGNDNIDDINNKFNTSIIISLVIGVISFFIIYFFGRFFLSVIFALEGQVLIEARNYINIFSLTIGLNLCIFIYSAVFKIFRKTSNIFFVCLTINILNVFLDYILVFGKFGFPKLGSSGAALGTVISLILNIIIYNFLVKNKVKINLKQPNFYTNLKQIVTLSAPMMGQEFFEEMFFVFGVNIIVARIGVIELSTYSLLLNIFNLLLMPMFAYASTNMTLVSEYISKDEFGKCKKTTLLCVNTTLLIYILSSIFVIIFKNRIPTLITLDIDIKNSFLNYIFIVLVINIFNIIKNIYKYSLQAINCEQWLFRCSFIANLITLILISLFSHTFGLFSVYLLFGLNYSLLAVIFLRKYNAMLH